MPGNFRETNRHTFDIKSGGHSGNPQEPMLTSDVHGSRYPEIAS
jgi:hypothetical protein